MKAQTDKARRERGFTLVEVLISIAIALVLIIGISQIFAMAQQASGAGTTMINAIMAQRPIQQTLTSDFQQIVTGEDSPGLVIVSYSLAAYRNKQDQQQNRGTSPLDFNDPSGGGTLPNNGSYDQAFSVSDRIHRVDRMCFFVRGKFQRQTADAPYFTSPTASNEAFIWLGHLALPNNNEITNWDPNNPGGSWQSQPNFLPPGAPGSPTISDDNNFYASDWILGRQVILLQVPVNPNPPEAGFYPVGTNPVLSTGASGTTAASHSQRDSTPIFASRLDLAYTSIAKARLTNQNVANTATWPMDLSGASLAFPPATPTTVGDYIYNDLRYYANPFPTKPGPGQTNYSAFSGNPAAWMSAAAAQTTPIFVRGCSQFIVEFAGNFLHQNQDPNNINYGQITAAGPDPSGKLDFIAYKDSDGTWRQQIRWYGFPRDVNGDGRIDVNIDPTRTAPPYNPQGTLAANNTSSVPQPGGFDVVPLANVLANLIATPPATQASFELTYPQAISLAGTQQMPMTPAVPPDYPAKSLPYYCRWNAGDNMPKLIRITIGIDDPSGRLNTEQLSQYIFALP